MDGTNGDGEGYERRETMAAEGVGGRRARMDPEGRECKILQPRGTHGDVISTTELETYYNSHNPSTTKSLGFHVWMAHSPWLVSRKVYLFRLPLLLLHTSRPLAFPRLIRDGQPDFCPFSSPNLWIHGTKISFFAGTLKIKMVDSEAARWRKRKEICTLLALQISFIMTLIIYYAESVISFSFWYMKCERHYKKSELETNLIDFWK